MRGVASAREGRPKKEDVPWVEGNQLGKSVPYRKENQLKIATEKEKRRDRVGAAAISTQQGQIEGKVLGEGNTISSLREENSKERKRGPSLLWGSERKKGCEGRPLAKKGMGSEPEIGREEGGESARPPREGPGLKSEVPASLEGSAPNPKGAARGTG